MVHVIESVLPDRFGGTPLDYQVQEEEAGDGMTRLVLRVSPRVGAVDEPAVVRALADGLQRSSRAGRYAGAIWAQAGSIRVRREEPVWTPTGKLPQMRAARPSSDGGPQPPAARSDTRDRAMTPRDRGGRHAVP
jgi:hypothetical protein